MDKLAKTILNFAIKNGGRTDHLFSLNPDWDGEASTTFQDLVDAAHASPADTISAVNYLEQNGSVQYRSLNDHGRRLHIAFRLTHEGLHYGSIHREQTVNELKKSILVPILVTILTNLVISGAKWVWPQLVQFLAAQLK